MLDVHKIANDTVRGSDGNSDLQEEHKWIMKHRRTENLSSKAKKPKNRTLAEFGKLTLAETIVLDACRKGMSAFLSPTEPYELPKEPTEQNTIRPEFIRFLALGGDENAPVHEVGVRVYGAWIDGNLDFQFCESSSSTLFGLVCTLW